MSNHLALRVAIRYLGMTHLSLVRRLLPEERIPEAGPDHLTRFDAKYRSGTSAKSTEGHTQPAGRRSQR